jgi:hypothetical protein
VNNYKFEDCRRVIKYKGAKSQDIKRSLNCIIILQWMRCMVNTDDELGSIWEGNSDMF